MMMLSMAAGLSSGDDRIARMRIGPKGSTAVWVDAPRNVRWHGPPGTRIAQVPEFFSRTTQVITAGRLARPGLLASSDYPATVESRRYAILKAATSDRE